MDRKSFLILLAPPVVGIFGCSIFDTKEPNELRTKVRMAKQRIFAKGIVKFVVKDKDGNIVRRGEVEQKKIEIQNPKKRGE